jgi:hypothetical protein
MRYWQIKINRIGFIGISLFLLVGTQIVFSASAPQYAVGVVYNDTNKNQTLDPGENGIKNIAVSNGQDIVQTDNQGKYRIPIEENMLIFVIKPTGWTTPFNAENRPQFYYIYKPNGSPQQKFPGTLPTGPLPKSIDFPLYPQQEPNRFKVLYFADTQVRNQQEINYMAHDVVEELIGTDAVFGITLGDNTYNDLSNYPSLNRTIALIGIPFYFGIGNHDSNFDAPDEKYANETFENTYGPAYYSFNYGKVHFILLDDIYWPSTHSTYYGYNAGLSEHELTFIRNDLTLVPKDRLVVLSMHIPITELPERTEIFKLLADHPNGFAIAGHEHRLSHKFFGAADGWKGNKPYHLFVNGAVCGSWWSSRPDELGIPNAIGGDGSPNGYAFVTFTGNKYEIEYKGARKPASYQINIFAPDEISLEQATATEVIVNIFAGSEKSKVEYKLGEKGSWLPMVKTEMKDPYFLQLKKDENDAYPASWRKLANPFDSHHIWKANLPAAIEKGTQLITVRTTDMFGHTYTGYRVITIRSQQSPVGSGQ